EPVAKRVGDVPHAFCRDEQALQLVALRDAERGREVVAVGAIQVAERATQLGLQPGPARRWQGAGPDRIGNEGDIDFGHFMSHLQYVTYFVTICNYDVKCQLCSLRPIGCRRDGRPRRPAREEIGRASWRAR